MSDDILNRPKVCGVVEGFYGRPWTFHQRKELFIRMHNLSMNTYLYAPKDDIKHRQMWRELYNNEECSQLKTLIDLATENNVMFVYAISPGLDITFSNDTDVDALKNKMKQVMDIGCNAFAILFDDIDPNLNVIDREKYESLAVAQVTLTNLLYNCLNKPKFFLFCPTEYCATRAVPSVVNSEYLITVGSRLEPSIDIMWTGPKVISKSITESSIDELIQVLHRCPVIWDNIHANDYDQKRMFLGPYCGRSGKLLTKLRGVLTNPNCEFEANYIAVFTLANWFNMSLEQLSSNSGVVYDPKKSLEDALKSWMEHLYKNTSTSENGDCCLVVEPKKSVTQALMATAAGSLPPATATIAAVAASQLLNSPSSPSPTPPVPLQQTSSDNLSLPDSQLSQQIQMVPPSIPDTTITNIIDDDGAVAALAVASVVQHSAQEEAMEICESEYIQVLQQEMIQNIQQDPDLANQNILENGGLDKKDETMQMQVDENIVESMEVSSETDTAAATVSSTEAGETTEESSTDTPEDVSGTGLTSQDMLTMDNLKLLVDLYYLPYEHGDEGVKMLELVHWLRSHAHLVDRDDEEILQGNNESSNKLNSPNNTVNDNAPCRGNDANNKTTHWQIKAVEFHNRVQQVRDLINRFCCITNKSVLSDFYSYLQDMRHILESLDSYIKWLESAKISYKNVCALRRLLSWCTPGYKEMFTGDDYESWMFRGGLIAEFQRMFPIDNAYDIYPVRASFIIYNPSDFSVQNLLSSSTDSTVLPTGESVQVSTLNTPTTNILPIAPGNIVETNNTIMSNVLGNTSVGSSAGLLPIMTTSSTNLANTNLIKQQPNLIQRAAPSIARSTSYNVRPYNNDADRDALYSLCFNLISTRMTTGLAGHQLNADWQMWSEQELLYNLPGDRYLGAYLDYNPEYCLVLENEEGVIIGYALGCVDIAGFDHFRIHKYNVSMRQKYSTFLLSNSTTDNSESDQQSYTINSNDPVVQLMLQYFLEDRRPILFTENSVLVYIDIREHCKPYDLDTIDSLLRKLFICIVSAFKTATAEATDINYPASLLNNSSGTNSNMQTAPSLAIVTQATLITASTVPLVAIGPVVQVTGRDRAPLISLRLYAEVDYLNKSHKEMYKRYGFAELETTPANNTNQTDVITQSAPMIPKNNSVPLAAEELQKTVSNDSVAMSTDAGYQQQQPQGGDPMSDSVSMSTNNNDDNGSGNTGSQQVPDNKPITAHFPQTQSNYCLLSRII